jgi:hypothetical protein
MEVVKNGAEHSAHNMNQGFRNRLVSKHTPSVEKSLSRAKTLRDGFFNGVDKNELFAEEASPPIALSPPSGEIMPTSSFAQMKQTAEASDAQAAVTAASRLHKQQPVGVKLLNWFSRATSPAA